jgi:NAD(P)H-flavin reductase
MANSNGGAASCLKSKLLGFTALSRDIFRMDFAWQGPAPKAGQFFMIKPDRTSVFLGRPVSVALWNPGLKSEKAARRRQRETGQSMEFLTTDTVRFLVTPRGKGTRELLAMQIGENAELTGPLGNSWKQFLRPFKAVSPDSKPVALVAGGIGAAPLAAFAGETSSQRFDFYLGLKRGFKDLEEMAGLLGPSLLDHRKLIIASEDGKEKHRGRITDFLDPADYRTVFACGPEPMLRVVAAKCREAAVPCYISLERRMACGVGACLGCTVTTSAGNRRCCADGPVFNAEEVVFDGQEHERQ